MDLDDFDDLGLGNAPVEQPQRSSRFAPKSAKLVPKQEPHQQPNLPTPPLKHPQQDIDVKPKPHIGHDLPMEEKNGDPQEPVPEPMEEDGVQEEDRVVQEIDVFFAPRFDAGTELYVMQYPLRPSWRPYEFAEKCKEVRVNPKEGKLEVDLLLDTETSYDHGAPERLQMAQQTLTSRRAPLETSYAVGWLSGNKLHLNPVDTVMQLRPSMEHLTPKGLKRSTAAAESSVSLDETTGVKDSGSAKKQGKAKTGKAAAGASTSEVVPDVEESWISLEYHGMGSYKSRQYQSKMMSQESSEISFSMRPSEYLNSLCPVSASTQNHGGLPIRLLLSMPLEPRLRKWLFEGSQLKRFDAVKHLTPNDSNEAVFEILQQHAWLVQGLWVPKSSKQNSKHPIHRDFVISLFQKNSVIRCSDFTKLEEYQLIQKDAEPHLSTFAHYRSSSATWELKVPKDESFIHSHPDIVKIQEEKWGLQERKLMDALKKTKMDRNSSRPGAKK